MQRLAVFLALFSAAYAVDFFSTFGVGAKPGENFTHEVFGVDNTGNIFVGVVFLNGNTLVTNCDSNRARLYGPNKDITVLGSQVHSSTLITLPYSGCNMINHPDGYVYYATPSGIVRLNPNNGFSEVPIAGRRGGQGIFTRLGMAVDPQNHDQIFFVSGSWVYVLTLSTNTYRLVPDTYAVTHDGMYFNENGTLIVAADYSAGLVRIFQRVGGQVAAVPIPGTPDGIAFHSCSNSAFIATNDGAIWRINMTSFTATKFASGGSRGDIGAVGPDGCFYMTYLGDHRMGNGQYYGGNAVVRICSAGCVFVAPPGVTRCGDGNIDAGEDCDGGPCCHTETCKFLPSNVTCRAAAGSCDLAEYCPGNNASCPEDKFAPNTTPCGELFGMCDVILKKTCPGNGINCYGPPAIPPLAFQAISWTDFNVISFDSFTCDAGDVEGRLAVKNKAALGDFTLGLQLKIASDGWKTTSLIVGGAASWNSGSLHPDGSASTFIAAGPSAFAYIGGAFNAPTYLQDRLVDPSEINRNIDPLPVFDQGKAYYTTIQSYLVNLGYNAAAELKYGDGIFITCNSATADVYHVKIDTSILSAGRWYTLSGCKFSSSWIIDVVGTGNVVIQGQAFPGIVERVIYNVVGSGRTISGDTGVAGHILAPQNTFTQSQGVTYGIVVAGNVTASRQNNKPNCLTFRPVVISTRVLKGIRMGDTNVYVADLSAFIAGDLVCINSDCRKIVAGSSSDVDEDGVVDHVVTVDRGFSSDHTGALFLTTSVSDFTQNRDTPLVQGATDTPAGDMSSASTLALAFFAIVAALLF